MIKYSQSDPRWANHKLGTCNDTIGQSGCFITSLAMLAYKTPLEVNDILLKGNGFVNGCMVNSERASSLLNLSYYGISKTEPDYPCIAETNFYAPKVPQHFFIWLGQGKIIDPLGGKEKDNPYPIISFRLFKIKNNDMTDEQIKNILKDYIKKRPEVVQEPPDWTNAGKVWAIKNGKKLDLSALVPVVSSWFVSRYMKPQEKNFTITTDPKDIYN